MCTYRVEMTVKLTKKVQELNAALLKVIEKDDLIEQLSEKLESRPFTLISIFPFF
jgi:GTP1/Obg family GTP-binding protein